MLSGSGQFEPLHLGVPGSRQVSKPAASPSSEDQRLLGASSTPPTVITLSGLAVGQTKSQVQCRQGESWLLGAPAGCRAERWRRCGAPQKQEEQAPCGLGAAAKARAASRGARSARRACVALPGASHRCHHLTLPCPRVAHARRPPQRPPPSTAPHSSFLTTCHQGALEVQRTAPSSVHGDGLGHVHTRSSLPSRQ